MTDDWVTVPCGCRSNRRTNEVDISGACYKAMHQTWKDFFDRLNGLNLIKKNQELFDRLAWND